MVQERRLGQLIRIFLNILITHQEVLVVNVLVATCPKLVRIRLEQNHEIIHLTSYRHRYQLERKTQIAVTFATKTKLRIGPSNMSRSGIQN